MSWITSCVFAQNVDSSVHRIVDVENFKGKSNSFALSYRQVLYRYGLGYIREETQLGIKKQGEFVSEDYGLVFSQFAFRMETRLCCEQ